MNLLWLTHLAALGVSLALGGVVFWTNPRRATNRMFLALTLMASAWIGVPGGSSAGTALGAMAASVSRVAASRPPST